MKLHSIAALAAVLSLATPAVAQTPPPPSADQSAGAEAPPPPGPAGMEASGPAKLRPPMPRDHRPHGPDAAETEIKVTVGDVKIKVECPQDAGLQPCADLANQLLDKALAARR